MKSNSLKEKFSKKNFVSGLKISSIISLCVILIAVVVVSIFNFNLGIDFTGGKIIDVKIGSELNKSENYRDVQTQIETIFNSEGFEIKSIQLESTSEDATVVVKFTYSNKINATNESTKLENLQTKLSSELRLNNETLLPEVSEVKDFSATISSKYIILAISAMLGSLALITIYLAIRFKLVSTLTILCVAIHDVLLMLSVVCLTRIEINSGFLVSVFLTLFLSLISSIVMFNKLQENKSRELYKDLSSESLANLTIMETFKRILIMMLLVLMIGAVMLIIGTNSLRIISLPLIIAVLVVFYSSIVLKLPLWSKMTKYSNNKKEK